MTKQIRNRSLAHADAVYESHVDAQWRFWRRYLESHQLLLTAQQATATPLSFEGTDDLDTQAKEAQDDLDHLPTDKRVLFDSVITTYRAQITEQYETRRREAGGHGPMPDVDEIDLEVLETLLNGASGASAADGRGLVPMHRTDHDELVWYSVDAALLSSVPDDETFSMGRVSDREKAARLMGIVALLVGTVLLGIVWFIWLRPGVAAETAAVVLTDPQINNQPVSVWPVTTLVLADGRSDGIAVPVQAVDTLESRAEIDTEQTPLAFWATSARWPLTICVAGGDVLTDLSAITSVRLQGTGETPDRIYTLHATAPASPDLILTMCAGRGADNTVRAGVIQRTEAVPPLNLGQAASLGATTTITLESLVGIGPAEDASVPTNRQVVIVTVRGATDLDWTRLVATLLVADGDRSVSPDIQRDGDRTVLSYSGVALMTMPTAVAWQIVHPETGRVVRWRTTLEPPPDRATILADMLVVEEIAADPVAPGESLTLHLVLSNRGSRPLVLTPDDIVLMQGTTRLTLPPIADLQEPILTDGRLPVTLTVPVDLTQPLTLILGAQSYQITGTAEGG